MRWRDGGTDNFPACRPMAWNTRGARLPGFVEKGTRKPDPHHNARVRRPRQRLPLAVAICTARDLVVNVRPRPMPSLTVENYVKAIYLMAAAGQSAAVSTGQIAAALKVSPGTVTSMLKTLDAADLATHRPYEGVALTRAGRQLALRMIRRHRLIELFLLRALDMNWDEVHDEAEHLEHAVSDLLIDRIDAYLGHPEVDPHGDPIPPAGAISAGEEPDRRQRSLADCVDTESFRLARVLDQTPEFLRYLADTGLVLGAEGVVEQNSDGAGLMRVRLGSESLSLALETAAKLLVESSA
jgi:DtxR family Mn-dependent transcriptional regulator